MTTAAEVRAAIDAAGGEVLRERAVRGEPVELWAVDSDGNGTRYVFDRELVTTRTVVLDPVLDDDGNPTFEQVPTLDDEGEPTGEFVDGDPITTAREVVTKEVVGTGKLVSEATVDLSDVHAARQKRRGAADRKATLAETAVGRLEQIRDADPRSIDAAKVVAAVQDIARFDALLIRDLYDVD